MLQFLVFYRKEGNYLFNDALNTFYLRLYGVRHMVMDHSNSERENPLSPEHGHEEIFICIISQTPACGGTSLLCSCDHSLWEWPIPTQLLAWGTLFAVRCDPWSAWWDPGGWVMVNICNQVYCSWQYTTSARNSCMSTRWRVEAWLMNWHNYIMSNKIKWKPCWWDP